MAVTFTACMLASNAYAEITTEQNCRASVYLYDQLSGSYDEYVANVKKSCKPGWLINVPRNRSNTVIAICDLKKSVLVLGDGSNACTYKPQ